MRGVEDVGKEDIWGNWQLLGRKALGLTQSTGEGRQDPLGSLDTSSEIHVPNG